MQRLSPAPFCARIKVWADFLENIRVENMKNNALRSWVLTAAMFYAIIKLMYAQTLKPYR